MKFIVGLLLGIALMPLGAYLYFTGGTLIEIAVPGDPDLGALREDLKGLQLGEVPIQEFGAKRVSVVVIPNASHALPLEQPRAVSAAIVAYARRL